MYVLKISLPPLRWLVSLRESEMKRKTSSKDLEKKKISNQTSIIAVIFVYSQIISLEVNVDDKIALNHKNTRA